MRDIRQYDTSHPIPVLCYSGNAPLNGVTPAISLRKNGAAAAAATGTVSASDAGGVSFYTPSPADVGTLGTLVLEISGAGIDSYAKEIDIVGRSPFDVVQLFDANSGSGNLALWDGSDLSTLFTNTGATTQVTANGQNVGAWQGKGWLNILATAPATPPTWSSTGVGGGPGVLFASAGSTSLDFGNPGNLLNLQNGSYTIAFIVQFTAIDTIGTVLSKSGISSNGFGFSEQIWYAATAASTNNLQVDTFMRVQGLRTTVDGSNLNAGKIIVNTPYAFIMPVSLKQIDTLSGGHQVPYGKEAIIMNGVIADSKEHAMIPFNTANNWRIGSTAGNAYFGNFCMGDLSIWSGDKTKEQNWVNGFHALANAKNGCKIENNEPIRLNENPPLARINNVYLGDSIMAGAQAFARGVVTQARFKIRHQQTHRNYGISGTTVDDWLVEAPYKIYRLVDPGQVNVAWIWVGTNNVARKDNPATVAANVKTLLTNLKANGFARVALIDMLSRTAGLSNAQTTGGFDADRATFNGIFAPDFSTQLPSPAGLVYAANGGLSYGADLLIRVSTHPIMGINGASTNTTNFTDPHPTETGHGYFAPDFAYAANYFGDLLTPAAPSVR